MNLQLAEQQSLQISEKQLLAFFRAIVGRSRGREDDDHPLPPGPWDPVIRVALERLAVLGPQPEPWVIRESGVRGRGIESALGHPVPWRVVFASLVARHPEIWDTIGGGPRFGDEVALNPQPLPPRYAFLVSVAQTVTSRVELLQEIADATAREGNRQGIVSGYLARFTDDFCGTDFRLKYPFPGPRPHWFAREIDGIDLVVMATQFEQAAEDSFNQDLRRSLADAGGRLAKAGLSRMA